MTDTRHLIVQGRFENIPLITEFIAAAALAAGFDDDMVFHCQMATDEACTNVIEHAYGGEGLGEIEVHCYVEAGSVRIEICDTGQPFDPALVPEPNTQGSIEDMKPGGIGLHIMKKVMDVVEFKFEEDQNTLIMIKHISVLQQDLTAAPDIDTKRIDASCVVIFPRGRMDSSRANQLEEILLEVVENQVSSAIVNFQNTTYISSKGLKALVTAWKFAQDAGRSVTLCEMSPAVYDIFEVVGFTQIFKVFDSENDAVSAVLSHD